MEENKKKVCVLMLQRNLPEISEKSYNHHLKWNNDLADFFVIESGSDDESVFQKKDHVIHADWDDARTNGMRWARGFNYGLLEAQKKSDDYEYFLLMNGDVELFEENTVEKMLKVMNSNPRIGMLSANSPQWGNDVKVPLGNKDFISHWQITIDCWMVRKSFLSQIGSSFPEQNWMTYLFDGNNFRGAFADDEVVMKAYQMGWMCGYTSHVNFIENHNITANNFEKMKTEDLAPSREKMTREGLEWIKQKYGCQNKQQYRSLNYQTYLNFFNLNPELNHLRCT